MLNDPCAPLRARLEAIQKEIQKRGQQPPASGGSILTPDDVASNFGTMSPQQLQAELDKTREQLRQCEAQHQTG